jgi:hypothetical protein
MRHALYLAAIACLLSSASATILARSPSLETPFGTSTPDCVLELMSDQAHDLAGNSARARGAPCPLLGRCRAVKFDIADHDRQDDDHGPAVRVRRRLLVARRPYHRERLHATRIIPRAQLHHRTRMLRRSWTHGRRPGLPPRGD